MAREMWQYDPYCPRCGTLVEVLEAARTGSGYETMMVQLTIEGPSGFEWYRYGHLEEGRVRCMNKRCGYEDWLSVHDRSPY